MANQRLLHPRILEYAQKDIETLWQDFHLSPDGFQMKEAAKQRELYGANRQQTKQHDSVLLRLGRAFCNPFTLILLVLAVVSFLTDFLPHHAYTQSRTTGIVLLVMLILSAVVRFIEEMRSKRATDQLLHMIHTTVTVRREGIWQELPSEYVVVGDRIRFRAGDRIPADLRLTKARDLFLSQSILTGESTPVEKNAKTLSPARERGFSQYENIAFCGSTVIGGKGEGIVLAVGKDTLYGESMPLPKQKTGFEKGANAIAWVLIRFMAVLIPLVFFACGLTKGNWGSAFFFALSAAVGLTPELLPMVINACLAKGSAAMGKKHTIVKNINAMQAFGSMDVLCADKTGTLTNDALQLEYYMDILGNECRQVLDYAYLNSLYHTGTQNHLDQAVLKIRELPDEKPYWEKLAAVHEKLDEMPFDYERKFASILVKDQEKNLLLVKGDPKAVCKRCAFVSYKGAVTPMPPNPLSHVHAITAELEEDGVKVLAVAYKPTSASQLSLSTEEDLILLGYLAFFDVPKKTAATALERLQKLHVPIKILTGDQLSVAKCICRRLSISTENALTGEDLARMSEDELLFAAEKTALFAELSPGQKAKIVSVLQENGHTVGFLGDGMNDLPAILEADVGISAEGAAKTLQEAADVILTRKDLHILEEGILEGRKVFVNMSKYIRISASSNFGNTMAVVAASIFLPFYPMASVQLLLLNLLYDVLCLVLPWDSVDEELYARPRPWSGYHLGRFMRFFGPISTLFDVLTFGFLFFLLCPSVTGGSFFTLAPEQKIAFIALFQTGWFLESLWTQVLILHLLRTKRLPFIQSRPAKPVLLVTVAGILLFTTLPFLPLGQFLGMVPMPPVYFGFLLLVVLCYLLFVTAAKARYVKKYGELI